MKIIDVNILIYLVDRQAPFHSKILAWWNTALNSEEAIGLAWIALSGFLRIATNSRLFPKALTVAEATEHIDAWLERPNVQLVQELPQHWTHFREIIRTVGTGGNRTTDAHLAALAISRGATLVSCDLGLRRFKHLRWENPAA